MMSRLLPPPRPSIVDVRDIRDIIGTISDIEHRSQSRTSSFELQDIIRVYPDEDCHCLGVAVSKKRRCRNVTSHDSQSRACALLAQGTRMLEAGRPIDRQLGELALLVLCKANHRYQAPELVETWQQDIVSYTQWQRQTVPQITQLDLLQWEQTIEWLTSSYHTLLSQSLRNVPSTPTMNISTPDREQRRSGSGRPPTQNRHAVSPSTVRTEPPPPRNSEETSQSTRRRTRRAEEHPQSPNTHTISEQNLPSPIRARSQPNPRSRASRQPIEGDCPICLDPLLPDDESSEDRIAWCAEGCGNNFHRNCLNDWIHSSDTPRTSTPRTSTPRTSTRRTPCPMCRNDQNRWTD
jgi:hypothetical protein